MLSLCGGPALPIGVHQATGADALRSCCKVSLALSSIYDRQRETADVFDYAGAMERLGHDAALFNELSRFFLSDSAALLERIRESFARDDRAALALSAHTLVGLASNFGAVRLTKVAAEIELSARSRDSTSSTRLRELESAIEELCAALRRHLDAGSSIR